MLLQMKHPSLDVAFFVHERRKAIIAAESIASITTVHARVKLEKLKVTCEQLCLAVVLHQVCAVYVFVCTVLCVCVCVCMCVCLCVCCVCMRALCACVRASVCVRAVCVCVCVCYGVCVCDECLCVLLYVSCYQHIPHTRCSPYLLLA